jgi:hypothetical protein
MDRTPFGVYAAIAVVALLVSQLAAPVPLVTPTGTAAKEPSHE